MTLIEDVKYDWHSSQPHRVQFEDYMTCESAVEVCGPQSIDQVLGPAVDQDGRRTEEEEEEEEAFLDAMTALEMARQYMFQFDMQNNIIIQCNKLEYELHMKERKNKLHLLTG
jgi:hypothetical protein